MNILGTRYLWGLKEEGNELCPKSEVCLNITKHTHTPNEQGLEYSDCKRKKNWGPGYDTKLHLTGRIQIWSVLSILSLQLLPGPL